VEFRVSILVIIFVALRFWRGCQASAGKMSQVFNKRVVLAPTFIDIVEAKCYHFL
jgi:hypothetical protein